MVITRRRRAAWVALALFALLVSLGCSTARSTARWLPAPAVVLHDGANSHTVSLAVGQRLEVILGSDYWTVAGSSVPMVLRQDGTTSYLPKPPDCGSIPGLGCIPIRTDFSALAPGTAAITASRLSCGEALRCMPGQQHFSLTVVVRAQ
jgi:hypothetical protein